MYLRVLIILRVNYSGRYSYQFGTTSGERITSTVLYEETRSGENLVQLSVNYEGGLKRTDVLHLEPQKFKMFKMLDGILWAEMDMDRNVPVLVPGFIPSLHTTACQIKF